MIVMSYNSVIVLRLWHEYLSLIERFNGEGPERYRAHSFPSQTEYRFFATPNKTSDLATGSRDPRKGNRAGCFQDR